jgi:hypothetical protein
VPIVVMFVLILMVRLVLVMRFAVVVLTSTALLPVAWHFSSSGPARN